MNFTISIRLATTLVLLAVATARADTEIHRCVTGDGTVAFQETPCAKTGTDAAAPREAGESRTAAEAPSGEDDAFDYSSPFDDPAEPVTPSGPAPPAAVSQGRAECEKTTRDAIDAIDLEMKQNTYSKEQGKAYLAELLALTTRLRACKQL